MLVVTANWAIPDGSVAALPRATLYARLFADIRLAAVRAGMRHDGRYRPIERLVVVLAGDTFDGLVSGRWGDRARPWDRGRRTMAVHEEVFGCAARNARRPLAAVARLARRGVSVPSADRRGRPLMTERCEVPVHIALLAGDRDAALERFRGHAWVERREIGIGSIWEGHERCVIHGSTCDPLAVGEDRPTLLESLAVDLLARFGATLAARPGLADAGRRIVRTLADGQPLDMPWRLTAALRALAGHGADAPRITTEWHRSVDHWERGARRAGCEDGHGELAAIAVWMHAMGDAAATRPAVREVIAALSAPLPAAASRPGAGRLTILGHPASAAEAAGGDVICLGASWMRPYGTSSLEGPVPGRASCIEAAPVVCSRRLPAVAVPEADEGGRMPKAWWPLWDAGSTTASCTHAVPILEAA